MKELLALIDTSLKEIHTRANTALSGMPPIEQFQGAQEFVCLMNTMKWVVEDVTAVMNRLGNLDEKFTAAMKSAEDSKIAAALEAGEVVKKVDSEAAVAAAELRVRGEVEGEFQVAAQLRDTIATRRNEITTAHGAEVAAALPDEALGGEGFDALKTEVGRRVEKLTGIGVTAASRKDTFTELLIETPFDADGGALFDKRVDRIADLAKAPAGSVAATRQPGKPGGGQPTVPAGGGGTSAKKTGFAF